MGIRVLDERHKQVAELILRGRAKFEIAREVGIDKSTIYRWMEDPVWLAYYGSLERDIEAARSKRLAPVVHAGLEALKAALNVALADIQAAYGGDGGDRAAMARIPSLPTLVDAVKKVVELERVDHGQPSSIKATADIKPPTDPISPSGRSLLSVLDSMAEPEGESKNTSGTAADDKEVH